MTDENSQEEKPKIHVDEDWKAQARAEKEKLAKEAAEEKANKESAGAGELPPASFATLVNSLMMQTLMAMGGMEDPNTGKRVIDLNLAKFHIDTLGILQEKTKGNLEETEEKMLDQLLHELRMNFMGFAGQHKSTEDTPESPEQTES